MKKKINKKYWIFLILAIAVYILTLTTDAEAYYYSNFETTYDPSSSWTNDGNANDENVATYATDNSPSDHWLHVKMTSDNEGWLTNRIVLSVSFYDGMMTSWQDAYNVDIDVEENGTYYNVLNDGSFTHGVTYHYQLDRYYHISEIRIRANDANPFMQFRVWRLEAGTPDWDDDYENAVRPIAPPLSTGSWKMISHLNNSTIDETTLRFVNDTNNYTWAQAISNNIIVGYLYTWDGNNYEYNTNINGYEGGWLYFQDTSYEVYEDAESQTGGGDTYNYYEEYITLGLLVGIGMVLYGGSKK